MPSTSDVVEASKRRGEMHSLVEKFDWASTPLGRRDRWSPALKAIAGTVLCSNHPMLLWWGPELIQIYNDAYRQTMGPERHPSALGQAGEDCWQEIWPIIGPQILSIRAGGPATFHEDTLVPLTRHGAREDIWWNYGYSPIPGESGVDGVLVVCTDVTASHLATREQARLNARLSAEVAQREYEHHRQKTLFQQAPGFMCILRGPDHVFEFANDAYTQLVGGRELVGKPVDEVIPEADGQGFTELLHQVYATGKPYSAHGLGIELRNTPGEPLVRRSLDFVYQPIIEADGKVSGIFVQGNDVSDRKAAQDALVAASGRKDEFLAMLAHELRNPLAPISAAAQMLKMPHPDAGTVRMAGEVIHRQAMHMSSLVSDLLDASRLSRDQVVLDLGLVDMTQVLAEAMEQAAPLIKSRGHRIDSTQSGMPAYVLGDHKRLVQVAANLLSNAAKFTMPGGAVSVDLRVDDVTDQVALIFRDSGVGIDAELLPRIFERFSQAIRSSDRSDGGLGIGLSLVRDIVHLHKGSVSASSRGPGRGSVFTVLLPREKSEASALATTVAAEAVPADALPAKGLRILVVDDNVDAAEMLAQWLRIGGHQVLVETSPFRALEIAAAFHADAYLLDIGLPGMDGNQLARRFRDTAHGRSARLIAISGYGQDENRKAARDAGFDHYCVKPVDTVALAGMLLP